MMEDAAWDYERFIRRAFGISMNRKLIDKSKDPASLADAAYFNIADEISLVKAGVAYAMSIYVFHARNYKNLSSSEDNKMMEYINSVQNATSHKEILELIQSFDEEVVNAYNLNNI
ncbi:hypothetical protein [Bacillus vallismortis]|uniref:hypothetical protein n=1 Tax=Bacillus vallismortis TaxID=72361 RepID=UPI002282DD70|nr:hypothetical protein [Bacillus vallismortis]MCY7919545.1 hypothetical protein [Bacillus vallismortis]